MPQRIFEKCQVPGCDRKHKARGYCASHYQYHLRGQSPPTGPLRERDMSPPAMCTVEGCENPTDSRGLCKMHYARFLRHGHTRYVDRKKPPKLCSIEGCENWLYAKNLCHQHYARRRSVAIKYGITAEVADQMLAQQRGVCAICGSAESKRDPRSDKKHFLSVDHDHSTLKVRGMLCARCNRCLGLLQDSPLVAARAIAYLAKHSPNPAAALDTAIATLRAAFAGEQPRGAPA